MIDVEAIWKLCEAAVVSSHPHVMPLARAASQLLEAYERMREARDRIYEIAKGTFAMHLMTSELADELDELKGVGQ